MRSVSARIDSRATTATALPGLVREDTWQLPTARSIPKASHRLQLDYIDGLRGLAALYIVMHHALVTSAPQGRSLAIVAFSFGQEVVAMFLTISGFCLALPQAMKSDWTVDAKRFYMRRAWRILPPYYATVALGIASMALQTRWGIPFPTVAVLQHLVLLHNWSGTNMFQVVGPLWSVALECQIYLLFPLLILLRRHAGMVPMLAIATLLALGSFHLLRGVGQTHFLAFFALGIFFAQAAFRPAYRHWLLWSMITGVVGFVAGELYRPHVAQEFGALFIGSLLAYLMGDRSHPVRHLLSWHPISSVGVFSYSIYLVHGVFMEGLRSYLRYRNPDFGRSNTVQYMLLMDVTALISVLFAYGFHRVVELPFMSTPRKATEARLAARDGGG